MPPIQHTSTCPAVTTGPVIAHRGTAGHAPENTLAGIVAARRLKCAWVEVDAKLTADGVVVLFHDDTLERTTDGSGPVATKSRAELATLDAGGKFAPAFQGERIPSLTEGLNLALELGLGVNIEIKPCPGRAVETADRVVSVLDGRTGPQVLVSSFEAGALAYVRDHMPGVPRALLVRRVDDAALALAGDLGCEGLHVAEAVVTAAVAQQIKTAGFNLRAFTVNCPVRAGALWSWGVDAVFSNVPDRLARP